MKIGIDARMADWSGVGRYTRGLLQSLATSDKNNDYFLIANPKTAHLLPKADNFSIIRADSPVLSLAGYREVGRLATRAKIDIFHALHFPVPLGYRGKIIMTLHDLTPLEYPALMPGWTKRFTYYLLNRKAVSRSEIIISDSAYTAKKLTEFFPAASKKINIVPLGIEERFFHEPSGNQPVSDKIDSLIRKPYLLAMGNQKAHKNLSSLINAFNELSKNEKFDYNLLLVGRPDPNHPQVVKLINESDAKVRIIFTGEVTDEELILLYIKADLFVFPSLYEGFGFPPLEAMACGTPVVCSNRASLPEVCGQGALLVEPNAKELAEATMQVLEDEKLRTVMVAKGKSRVEKFNWEETAKKMIEIYGKMLKGEKVD